MRLDVRLGAASLTFSVAALFATHGAATPAAAPPAPAAVILQSPRSPAYVVCPGTARTRPDCEAVPPSNARLDPVLAGARRAGVASVVVFVGGFRTDFGHGLTVARRVARVLGDRFFVVYVDWGSKGKALDYELDARAAKRNVPAFAQLVSDLHRALPDRPIGVFAHSMGARVVAGAMRVLRAPSDGSTVVGSAVLAAPDLALGDYMKAITRKPEPFRRVVIYSSRSDRALELSEVIHLHHRLGQVALWRHAVANTIVVDASAADTVADGHGYAIRDPRVIADIGQVLIGAPVPHPGWSRASGAVWRLDPARVAGQ
jgi:esterase/lipase superfamily enzyme